MHNENNINNGDDYDYDFGDECQCGPFSITTKDKYNHCKCTCQDHYIGSPPYCRPECLINSDCASHQSCSQYGRRCVDPCQDACGINADCKVINHRAFCSCKDGRNGDPYIKCSREESNVVDYDLCKSSPCGQFATCRITYAGDVQCECLPDHIGQPPLCHPECKSNYDCHSDQACINDKCENPCQGACGLNADCQVVNHSPRCTCSKSYAGDPYDTCSYKIRF